MKTRSVFSSIAVLAFIACIFYPSAAQRSQERLIRRLPVEKDEPIEITDIKVDGQSVSLDKKFTADDEWLRSLVFSVKNKSDKRILYASIRLQFPRPAGSKGLMALHDMYYGNWALQTRLPKPEDKVTGIAPGETVEMALSIQQYVDLKSLLDQTGFPPSIARTDISIAHIIFADDTMWYAGAICRRDPKEPSTWINSEYANSKPQ
jgi:hypothetical protein